MNILISCQTCQKERIQESFTNNESPENYWVEFPVPLTDDAIMPSICPKGHRNIGVYRNHKFTLLFEIGVNAIIDAYYREAVSSFASSLERFYEFYIRLIMQKFKLDEDCFESTWKVMKNLSERQLGAFISAYLIQNKKIPPLLSNKDIEFRNSVIHKGEIPGKEKVIDFGNKVLSIINTVFTEIHSDIPEELELYNKKREEILDKKLDKMWEGEYKGVDATLRIVHSPIYERVKFHIHKDIEKYISQLINGRKVYEHLKNEFWGMKRELN